MKIIISAGGTGGHIYPALAIINKIKEKSPNSEILYIGTTDRMEKNLVPEKGINYVGIEMKGLNRKNILSNIKVLKMYNKAVKKSFFEMKKFNPDIVIGVGGYITAPVLMAAHKLKIKILIHEQNSIPGISNKLVSHYADRICVSLPGSLKYFNKSKVVYTGNPRSEEIVNISKENKKSFGFDENKKLVVFVMGSLGSFTMNEKIKDLIPNFNNKDYQVLIITGDNYYSDYTKIKLPDNVIVKPFLNNLINLLKDTDLIISRAGASTIAEITAIGLPAILVPSPYVTNNHQYKNARELENNGACKLITEDDFSNEIILSSIDEILNDKYLYNKMHLASQKLGVKDSASRIYEEIKKIVKDDSNE